MTTERPDNFAIIDVTNFAELSEEEQVRRVRLLLTRLAGPGRIVDHGALPTSKPPTS